MSVGQSFLYSLLVETDPREDATRRMEQALRHNVDSTFFDDEEDQRMWDFLRGYFDRYRTMPSIEVAEIEADYRFPDFIPEEPFDYWLEQLLLYNRHVFLEESSHQLQTLLDSGQTLHASDLVGQIHQGLTRFELSRNSFTLLELGREALRVHDDIQHGNVPSGIMLGFPYLDLVTGGAQPGDVWAIIGRPSTGKTFVACRAGMGAHGQGARVLKFALEMTGLQVARRDISMGAQVTSKYLRLGRLSAFARQNLQQYIEQLERAGNADSFIIVEGRLNLSVHDVLTAIRIHRPDLVVIDGAYMLRPASPTGRQLWEKILAVVNELKQVAQNESVPILATFQFNRKGEKEKTLENIGGTDAIGQVASIAISLADEPGMSLTFQNVAYKTLELIKGREGERGKIRIRCDMNTTQIEEHEVLVGDESVMHHRDSAEDDLLLRDDTIEPI